MERKGRENNYENDLRPISSGEYSSFNNNIKSQNLCDESWLESEWLATDECELPTALEQAFHFIKSGELDDYAYYTVRWRFYEQEY